MHIGSDDRSELFAAIYDAPFAERGWSAVAARMARALDAHQAIIILERRGNAPPDVQVITHGVDPAVDALYQSLLGEDRWLLGMYELPAGTTCRSEQFIALSDYRKARFFREICEPAGVAHMAGAIIDNDPDRFACIACQRSERSGAFDDHAVRAIADLQAHVSRARFVQRRLEEAGRVELALHERLEHAPYGAMALNEWGTALWWNLQMEALLRQSDGVSLARGKLQARTPRAQQTLRALIRDAARLAMRPEAAAGDWFALPRGEGRQPLHAVVVPADRWTQRWGARAAALVFVIDPERPPPLSVHALSTLYGLTSAEVRLCRALSEGLTLSEAADRACVSRHTVRSQLKSVFRKCGVSSQAQLMVRLFGVSMVGA